MPFPYAYYREEYNGPLHGTELEAPLFIITPPGTIASSGAVDIAGKSFVTLDTSGSNLVIDRLTGAKEGQILFLRKGVQANSVTFTHAAVGAGSILCPNKESYVIPSGRYGVVQLICKLESGVLTWSIVENTGIIGDGTALAPGLTFANDPDTGIFRVTNNTLGFTTGGTNKLSINTALIQSLIPHLFTDGSAAAPSIGFVSDPDTGFYKATDKVVFSGDAVDRLAFTKAGNLQTSSALALLGFDNTTLMRLRVGSLLSSDNSADDALVPANGIYSKGHVKTAGQFQGTATQALFADLAENYESDMVYPAGTIVRLGGPKEITLANGYEAFGVISTDPGFLLNAGAEGLQLPVALQGRVPCRVIGKVKKFDSIWSCGNGLAATSGNVKIGRALEDKDTEEEGLVLISTKAVL